MKFKRIIPFVCMLLLINIFSPMALAYDPETPPNDPLDPDPYTYIATIDVYFDISGSGLTDDYCRVYIPNSSCSCWVYLYLERWNSNNGEWDVVKSWSNNGSGTITIEKEWYVTYGYAYQLRSVIYVYDSNGLLAESTTAYSQIIPYGATYP